jgi:hypothetical protein
MPSIMVYTNNEVYNYLFKQAEIRGITPPKLASLILSEYVDTIEMGDKKE